MRFGLVFSVLSTVACQESGVKVVNAAPEAYITSHATGDSVREGDTETLLGQVSDTDHALSELTAAWLYNGEPVCPDSAPDETGALSCDVTFTTEGGDVTLTVSDPAGETATARVSLDVQPSDAPTAALASPVADGVYYSDQSITFQGTVSDVEDSPEDLTVTFETDALGDLGLTVTVTSEGATEAYGTLDEGEHVVRLVVVDTAGKEGTDSVLINVGPPNSAPLCGSTAPADGSAGAEGDEVRLEGTATDADIAPSLLTVEWTSDKDGPLGESTPDSDGSVGLAVSDLSSNTHRITLTVTDELGEPCTDSIYYTVGTPPVLNVTAPTDGTTLNHSDAVVFEATVEDNEDLPNEVSLSWESDIDGVFSTAGADSSGAATVSIDTLSAGDHTVTVTATDTDGLFVTDTVSFNLNQPPTVPTVTLSPDPAATNQMLVATASGSEDPEGTGTVTYAYEWFEDGVLSAESTSATFPASATAKHHSYRVQVTASDGLVESAFGYAEVNVINSDPVLSGPTLSAETAVAGDVLTCTASATDVDPEDSPAVTYAWSDASTGPTYTVTLADAFDSTITCTATANDADGGVVTGTASATVTNTAPTVTAVTISPDPAYNNDTLVCAATATDPEGTDPEITYEWTGGATGPELPLTSIIAAPYDTFTCTATASDGDLSSDPMSELIIIANRDPVVTATLTPAEPTRLSTLTCTASDVADADDDATSLAFAWTINDAPAIAATTDDESILGEAVERGDTVVCAVTVTDSSGGTATSTATATIRNTPPVVSDVTLSPGEVYTNDVITASATITDGEESADELDVTYRFFVGVDMVQEGSSNTLDGAVHFDKGDDVYVAVMADDGLVTHTETSSTLTVLNSPPTAPGITIDVEDVDNCSSVELNGESDMVEIPYSTDWDFGSDSFTIEMWFKPSASHRQALFAFENDYKLGLDFSYAGWCGGADRNINMWASTTGSSWNLLTADAGGGYACGTVSLDLDQWHHVAFVRSENRWMTFLNGEKNLDITVAGSVVNREESMRLGAWGWDREPHFDGLIDDFRVSSVARYTDNFEPSVGFEPDEDTLGLWLFNEGTGTSSLDVARSHTASFVGSTNWSTECPGGVALERTLTCSIDEESTDADGDPISYTFGWDVDGEPCTDTDSTTHTGDTVNEVAITDGDEWTCEVTPNDGDTDGVTASSTISSCDVDADDVLSLACDGRDCDDTDPDIGEECFECRSLTFDGGSSFVDFEKSTAVGGLAGSDGITDTSSGSFEAWIYPLSSTGTLMNHSRPDLGSDQYLRIHLIDGALAVSWKDELPFLVSGGSVPVDVWTHVRVEDGSGSSDTALFINEIEVDRSGIENPAGWGGGIGHAYTYLGVFAPKSGFEDHFEGYMVDVFIDGLHSVHLPLDEGSGDVLLNTEDPEIEAFGVSTSWTETTCAEPI